MLPTDTPRCWHTETALTDTSSVDATYPMTTTLLPAAQPQLPPSGHPMITTLSPTSTAATTAAAPFESSSGWMDSKGAAVLVGEGRAVMGWLDGRGGCGSRRPVDGRRKNGGRSWGGGLMDSMGVVAFRPQSSSMRAPVTVVRCCCRYMVTIAVTSQPSRLRVSFDQTNQIVSGPRKYTGPVHGNHIVIT